jgi:hypothetical protein
MAAEYVGNAGGSAPGGVDALTAESPAGGSHPHEAEAPDVPSGSGASQADTSPESDDDDALLAEDDFSDVPFHAHPRFKAVTKRLSKALRQVSRLRPLAERAKGIDLDALRMRAGAADQVEAALARRPELRKQLFDALSGEEPAAPQPAAFDPASLPFDVNDDVGKYFVAQHQTILELRKQIGDLTGHLQQTHQRDTATQKKQYEQSWRSASDAASAQLRQDARELFQDAMYGAYRVTLAEGRPADPQKFINQYLAKLKTQGLVTGPVAARAKEAAAQRIAEGNSRLPRQPAGGGAPASPRNKAENVKDVSRRLFGRAY